MACRLVLPLIAIVQSVQWHAHGVSENLLRCLPRQRTEMYRS